MVSVIIPIYNVAPYLERCLSSLLSQKNTDFEVLMVNDGSTDNSREICVRFSAMDNRFKLFDKPNGGVSSARNIGLQRAQGAWIAFVDADDYVDADYLTVPDSMRDSDVIEKSYDCVDDEKILIKCTVENRTAISGNLSVQSYYASYIADRSLALWNKLIARRIVGDALFDENVSMGEDFMFFLNIFPNIQKYDFCILGVYKYYRREESASINIEKDYAKRVKGLFDNNRRVRELASLNRGMRPLCDYITHQLYAPRIAAYKSVLSCSQKAELANIYSSFITADKRLIAGRKRFSLYKLMVKGLFREV